MYPLMQNVADHISKRYLEKLKLLLSSATKESEAVAEKNGESKEEEGVEQTDPESSVFCVRLCVCTCV